MTPSPAGLPYSFSMINLVKLMPEWSWDAFDQVMDQAGTNRVELVPSMLLGMDWDQQIEEENGPVQQALERLMERYTVGSIQSLTYGLQINLADQLINHPELLRRLKALGVLARTTGCSVLILGSPGQKKQLDPDMSSADHKQRFIANCSWMARTLGTEVKLSLEHNTVAQGAEYCNTLAEIIDAVKTLRAQGIANTGINLDTKCLIQEFGDNIHVGELLANHDLAGSITSIQVSFDFLTRNVPHRAEDHRQLLDFARALSPPLSLEEFGLIENQLLHFVDAWNFQT
jgi:sugar phosphate isomerase/epimerase